MNSSFNDYFKAKWILAVLMMLTTNLLQAKEKETLTARIEPPEWWIGFQDPQVQLLIYAKDAGKTQFISDYPGLEVVKQEKAESPNYLFVTVKIDPAAKPGKMNFLLKEGKKKVAVLPFELHEKNREAGRNARYNASDIIYLLMPDRFSNGEPGNDSIPGMLEKCDRSNPDGRHGGDLQGIMNHLDYFTDFGIDALWLNPVYENNQERLSYHGYSITNYYQVDPRLGGNAAYAKFAELCHQKDIALIKDMIFNHLGSNHWMMKDLPFTDWIHQWNQFTRTNYRAMTVMNPYASEYDKRQFFNGWFDTSMPDLNQRNPFVATYLYQQSIWWVEKFGLDGIRMDTQAYNDPGMMSDWAKKIKQEYPGLYIFGEIWDGNASLVSYWNQETSGGKYPSNLDGVTDFPIHDAVKMALNEEEGWYEGFGRLYKVLSEDYHYKKPYQNVIFPDNHDLERIYEVLGYDFRKFKMAMIYYYTMRGNLQVYYGTEMAMTGNKSKGDGAIRADMAGGWAGDEKSIFTLKNLSKNEREAYELLRFLNYWRNGTSAIHTGKLTQYIPDNKVYVYFRYNDQETYMIVLNKNTHEIVLDPAIYEEHFRKFNMARDILTGIEMKKLSEIKIPAEDGMILKLGKFSK